MDIPSKHELDNALESVESASNSAEVELTKEQISYLVESINRIDINVQGNESSLGYFETRIFQVLDLLPLFYFGKTKENFGPMKINLFWDEQKFKNNYMGILAALEEMDQLQPQYRKLSQAARAKINQIKEKSFLAYNTSYPAA